MAKELPYFKFEPNAWENGNIQICTREDKGLFMDLCSMYWSRLGDVPFKLAIQKLCAGNATALNSLCEAEIIKVIDNNICIDFLNEQLSGFENTSQQNSENARLGWEKRRKKAHLSEIDATASKPQSETDAIREDKSRKEDKRKEDTHSAFDLLNYDKVEVFNIWIKYRTEIKKPYKSGTSLKALVKKFNQEDLKKCNWVVDNSIQNGYQGLLWENYKETNGTQIKTFSTNR